MYFFAVTGSEGATRPTSSTRTIPTCWKYGTWSSCSSTARPTAVSSLWPRSTSTAAWASSASSRSYRDECAKLLCYGSVMIIKLIRFKILVEKCLME